MSITPRDSLDFIQHFFKPYNKKISGLEEEQLHINVGLNKIAETVAQVEEIQKSQVESAKLESKNIEANDQQTKDITVKRSEVMKDLERVQLAVIDVQNAVKNIKKQHAPRRGEDYGQSPCDHQDGAGGHLHHFALKTKMNKKANVLTMVLIGKVKLHKYNELKETKNIIEEAEKIQLGNVWRKDENETRDMGGTRLGSQLCRL